MLGSKSGEIEIFVGIQRGAREDGMRRWNAGSGDPAYTVTP